MKKKLMSLLLAGSMIAGLLGGTMTAKAEDNDFTISDYQLQGRHDFSPNLRETITFTKQCSTADGIIYLKLI